MRPKWKFILISVVALVIGVTIAYRIAESPRRILRHALRLQQLPPSLANLRTGSDVWTDEVRGFYFEIAPSEFPALLVGRDFRLDDTGGTFEAHTIRVSPPISFIARWQYQWQTKGAHCRIMTTEEKNRVIAVFAAD